ncbi:hypothetical protein F4804DRAFT_311914 [Jackrogersella minutella]|nr:hypothetical protein F4804DRAFT_311914 [Jackrogersella minutella]
MSLKMGWLSFLTRKPPTNDFEDCLKAQAYDETVAANPPIRGTLPVAGNGPNILESIQKSHPHLKDANLNVNSVPNPAIPSFLERPRTAPSNRSPERSAIPKSKSGSSVKLLPQPFKKRHGPYKLPSKKAPNERTDDTTDKSIYSAPSITFTRDRNSSIFSGDSGAAKRFIDLLDAQSHIKPSDFYGRVKATGARDYGEDVALRNLPENMSNINSEQTEDLHENNVDLNIQAYEEKLERPRSSKKRHSIGSGLRSRPTSSSFQSTLSATVSSQITQENEDMSELKLARKAPRRKSLHSYVPPSSIEPLANRPKSAPAGKRIEGTALIYFPDSLRERARAAAQKDFERDLSTRLSPEAKSTRSSKRVREILDTEDSDSDISCHARNDLRQPQSTQVDQYRPVKNSPRRRTISNISLTTVKSQSKRDHLQRPQVPSHRTSIIQGSLLGLEEDMQRKRKRNSSARQYEVNFDFHESFYEFPSLQPVDPAKSISTYSHRFSGGELDCRDRSRSVVSVSVKSIKRPEIGDTIPERGSSIRRWSLTSETAGSTLSSNPFRPQSGHTTNTSVDLAPRVLLPKATASGQTSFLSRDGYTTPESQTKTGTPEPLHHEVSHESLTGSLVSSTRRQPSIDFVIDDDTLSIDSIDGPRHSAGEFEKDLLFEGYGMQGSQLPGLPGLVDGVVSKPGPRLSHRRTPVIPAFGDPYNLSAHNSGLDILPLGSRYSTRSSQYTSHPRSPRLHIPNFSDGGSEDNGISEPDHDSEDELNFDIPLKRSGGSRYSSQGNRRRYETATGPLMEDDSEIPDIARVARHRRESKVNQRASGASLRKTKGKGKAPNFGVPRIGLDDSSSWADVE